MDVDAVDGCAGVCKGVHERAAMRLKARYSAIFLEQSALFFGIPRRRCALHRIAALFLINPCLVA